MAGGKVLNHGVSGSFFCQPARLAPDLGYDSLSNLAKLVADGAAKRSQE